MKEAGTIKLRDSADADEAFAIVRYDEKSVALCISRKSDGDMEVMMGKADACALLDALRKATE